MTEVSSKPFPSLPLVCSNIAMGVSGRRRVHLAHGSRTRPHALGPSFGRKQEVGTMSADFEHFNDDDELWLSEMETRAIDLENELSVWREAREQALADQDYAEEPVP